VEEGTSVSFQIDPQLTEARIEIARALFAAWSSGDPDAPRAYLREDAVLFDIIGGEHRGWPAIRAYFRQGLDRYPDLVLAPTGDFWARPDGLAMLWVMTGTQTDDGLGAAAVGRRWSAEGLSYLVFEGMSVIREADYHDQGSRERSLRVTSS
jgi:SnoaL-like domain